MPELTQGEIGRVIAHYVVERVLGRGSAGIVYLARDTRINRYVALKSIDVASQRFEDARDANEFYQRLQREVEVCGALNHPNLVTLYDAGYDDGRVTWLALEYVEGESLLETLRAVRPAPLPPEVALALATDILQGLAYAHGKGIVHRDIKPANVLVGRDGVAKIADFGIARPSDSLMTVTGTLMGTPNYMSPEQVKGLTATPQSDLFSFGVVLYELLTARKAFGANDVSGVLYNIVHREHEPIDTPGVPPEIVQLVDRLLAKSRDARPADANEALEAVRAARARLASSATLPVAIEPESTEPGSTANTSATLASGALGLAVPRRIATLLILAASLPLAITLAIVVPQLAPSRDPGADEMKLRELEQKRQQLQAAEALCADGKLDPCIAAYEAYLASYPWAQAAKDAREEAIRLRTAEQRGEPKAATKSAWQRFKSKVKRVFD